MLQLLPQKDSLIPRCANPIETVEHINRFIEKNSCENVSIDISFMNVIDACYVSTLCATKHYIKYPNGKIHWVVSSNEVREFNKDLDLGNCEYLL